MSDQPMTCPECGSLTSVADGAVAYHTRNDNLAVCSTVGNKVKTKAEAEKPARKPRTKK